MSYPILAPNSNSGDFNTLSLQDCCLKINSLPFSLFEEKIRQNGDKISNDEFKEYSLLCSAFSLYDSQTDVNILNYLLDKLNIDINLSGGDGSSLVHIICSNIANIPLSIFKKIFEEKNANINHKDLLLNTPLHKSFFFFRQTKNNSTKNSKSAENAENILLYLLQLKTLNITQLGNQRRSLLHCACLSINHIPLSIFQHLISNMGLDINQIDSDQNTPCHIALNRFEHDSNPEILNYLLNQAHIDPNITDHRGYTLLSVACDKISEIPLGIFQLLIQNGANINHTIGENEDTPVHIAITRCRFEKHAVIIMYLLNQNTIRANQPGRHGVTLLHRICSNRYMLTSGFALEAFKILIGKNGADINAVDNSLSTPFHDFFLTIDNNCDENTILYLLNQDIIDINRGNQFYHTILHRACFNINSVPVFVFKVLIGDLGADIYLADTANYTPIEFALMRFTKEGQFRDNLVYLLGLIGITIDGIDILSRDEFSHEFTDEYVVNYGVGDGGVGDQNDQSCNKNYDKILPQLLTIRSFHSNLTLLTKYVVKNGLIRNPIDAKKYLKWLICSPKIDIQPPNLFDDGGEIKIKIDNHPVKFVCKKIKIDYFGNNDNDNTIPFQPLIMLLNRASFGYSRDGNPDDVYFVIEFLIDNVIDSVIDRF
jgi:ankyrin repeat protein